MDINSTKLLRIYPTGVLTRTRDPIPYPLPLSEFIFHVWLGAMHFISASTHFAAAFHHFSLAALTARDHRRRP
ncbi:MAG TPA: hypothetical protein VNM48_06430 [Chloroflexota bacterium]|nr:hypothetical protein [Chloroflexota bacterium]